MRTAAPPLFRNESRSRLRSLAVVSVALVLTACASVQRWGSHEESQRRAAQLQDTQLKVMRYADDYSGQLRDPLREFSARAESPEERLAAQNWNLSQSTAAYTIASGPNPTVNALDMIVLASLSRMVLEDQWVVEMYGRRAVPLLEVHRELERRAWTLVDGVLGVEQRAQLLTLIIQWRTSHPDTRAVAQIRFVDFVQPEGRPNANQPHSPQSLFSLIGLDPLGNLDPAVRELEQTRLLADRTIYYLQRAPNLLDMQIERLTYQVLATSEAKRLLVDASRLGLAAESAGRLSDTLPQTIAQERDAALRQIQAILEVEQPRLQQLLMSAQDAIEAANQTSGSLTQTIGALDAFTEKFRRQPGQAPSTSKPFDITHYTDTARELGTTTQELAALLTQLTSPEVEDATQNVAAGTRALIDHIFWRCVQLIVLVLVAALTYLGIRRRTHTKAT